MAAPPQQFFKEAYSEEQKAPWEIDGPQKAIQTLFSEHPDLVRGRVLDVCCGVGFNTTLISTLPHVSEVVGVDFNTLAIARAGENAKHSGSTKVSFIEADVLQLAQHEYFAGQKFDTILDSASYHCFSVDDRPAYMRTLAAVSHLGTLLVLLVFSDRTTVLFPAPRRISEEELREVFSESNGWRIESLQESEYLGLGGLRPAFLVLIRRIG